MTKRNMLIMLTVLMFAYSCTAEPEANRITELNVSIMPDFILGENTAGAPTVFGNPIEIRTDQNGRIYITDPQTHAVQIFDRSGNYESTIGRVGNGPGEFRDITAMDVTPNGELIVMDSGNRRITWFTPDFQVLDEFEVQDPLFQWPQNFRQLPNGNYMLLRKDNELRPVDGEKERYLQKTFLHLYDESLIHLNSFAKMDQLMGDDDFSRFYSAAENPGHFMAINNEEIWFAPGIYSGNLFRFQQVGSDTWEIADSLSGQLFSKEPVNPESDVDGSIQFTFYTPTGNVSESGYISSESLGLYELSDKRIVHFSSQVKDDQRVIIVEIFHPQNGLEGFGQLDEFNVSADEQRIPIGSIWKDNQDRFYIIDNRDLPAVIVGELQGI